MLKIDIHNHILPKSIPDFKSEFGYGGFIGLHPNDDGSADMIRDDGKFFRRVDPNCISPEVRLKEMQQFNVDVQVLSTVPVMFSEWAKPEHTQIVNRFLNEDIAKTVKENPKHFVGLGTVPLNDTKLAVDELHFCMSNLGLKGIQLGSHYGELNLNDKSLFDFYAEAEKLDAALLIHPWDMMGKDTMPDYWLPWLVGMPAETSRAICNMIFGGVFEKFPKLKVCFAHGGGSFPATLGRIRHGYNVRPDLCQIDNKKDPIEYLGKFWIDSITHDPVMLRYIIELLGEDSIMLGTDYPFPLGELEPGRLIESMDDLSKSTKGKILGSNALEWLGMSEEDFK